MSIFSRLESQVVELQNNIQRVISERDTLRSDLLNCTIDRDAWKADAARLSWSIYNYDTAIKSCVNDPEKMSSFCTAQGDTLDTLYQGMLDAIAAHEKMLEGK